MEFGVVQTDILAITILHKNQIGNLWVLMRVRLWGIHGDGREGGRCKVAMF